MVLFSNPVLCFCQATSIVQYYIISDEKTGFMIYLSNLSLFYVNALNIALVALEVPTGIGTECL